MSAPTGKAVHSGKTPKITGHTPTDARNVLNLSSKPLGYYQLTPPTLGKRTQSFSLLGPEDKLHLTLDPPPVRLLQEHPYPGLGWPLRYTSLVPPPVPTYLSIETADQLAQEQPSSVKIGVDVQLDPYNFTLSYGLDFLDLGLQLGPLKFFTDPQASGQFTFNPPGSFMVPSGLGYGPFAAGLSFSILKTSLADDVVDLSIGQVGLQIDSTGKLTFPFGVQAEAHLNPKVSLVLTVSGNLKQPDPEDDDYNDVTKNQYRLKYDKVVLGTLLHF